MTFKPMLAATAKDLCLIRFPVLASPKLDGVRAFVRMFALTSRSGKLIANRATQASFGTAELEGFDGELMAGTPTCPTVFRDTSSATASHEGRPVVDFHVFDDLTDLSLPFAERLSHAMDRVKQLRSKHIKVVPHRLIKTVDELLAYEAWALAQGYEGVMLRDPEGVYKQGRSTMGEGGLLKLKRFEDAEAKIIGFQELMHNTNEAKTNELGYLERSSKRAGLRGARKLGALLVRGLNGPYAGVEFGIGTGFDDADRARIWKQQESWYGEVVKYKYFPGGSKDAPRFPVYLGRRDPSDL